MTHSAEPTKPKASAKKKATAAKKPAAAKSTATKKPAGEASSQKSNATKPGASIGSDRLAGARSAVGVVKGAANRVGSLVSPVTDRVGGSQVSTLRTQVESILRQAEKRGSAVLANEKLKNFGDRAEKIQSDLTKALGQVSNLRP